MAAAVIIIVAAVLIFVAVVPKNGKLVLSDGDTAEVYAKYDVQEGDRFSVSFIHSVNKSRVKEVYEIKSDGIYLEECIYSAFGAGVATEVEEGQTLTYNDDGEMVISGFNRKIDALSYIVGTVSDHILEINGEEISLRELCGRNSVVHFDYKK
jgi:hypothetical protein